MFFHNFFFHQKKLSKIDFLGNFFVFTLNVDFYSNLPKKWKNKKNICEKTIDVKVTTIIFLQ
jgi:hypothetical protein